MPSLLKSLELQGYKTFASHTSFEFSQAVTAIVGPNGSGKSNIADSIRWVLGEQSYSLLRGKRTEDMIFAGSELRPRASMASATLIFDNSDGWLPIDFSEVAITRRAYRDGENEYLLNGQRVRLKDISELLARSGLAERTYTVIGQGLVDAALALKAEERRRLFEEAAGIGLYRSRREEALRRLEMTRRNLERVQDILVELLPRLHSLERQARRAQEYEQVRADLRILLRDWYGYHWHSSQRDLAEAHESVHHLESGLNKEHQNYSIIADKLSEGRERLVLLRARLNSWHQHSSRLHSRREEISRSLAVADERSRSLKDQAEFIWRETSRLDQEHRHLCDQIEESKKIADALTSELEEAKNNVASVQKDLQIRQAERSSLENEIHALQQNVNELGSRQGNLQARLNDRQAQFRQQELRLSDVITGLEAAEHAHSRARTQLEKSLVFYHQAERTRLAQEEAQQSQRQKIADGEIVLRKTQETRNSLNADIARSRAQMDVLDQAENAFMGYANGTRLLLQAAKTAQLKGIKGALNAFLEVSKEYEAAISAAFGEYVDAVVLDHDANVDEVLEQISDEIARAALLPLKLMFPVGGSTLVPAEDVLKAVDLVRSSPELRPVLDVLLENVYIVPDKKAARSLVLKFRSLDQVDSTLRVITKRGEVFYASGPILAGKETKSGLLSRSRERKELREQMHDKQTQLVNVDSTLTQLNGALNQLWQEEERLKQDLIQFRKQENEAQSTYLRDEIEVEKIDRRVQFLQEQRIDLGHELSSIKEDIRKLTIELAALDIPISQARDDLRKYNALLSDLSIDDLQAQVSYWNTRIAVSERAASDAQSRLREQHTSLARLLDEQKTTLDRNNSNQRAYEELELEKIKIREVEGITNSEIDELQLLIAPSEKELDAIEGEQDLSQKLEAQARQVLNQAEQRYTQAKINLARKQETLDGLRHRIEDDFGLVAFEYADEVSGPTPLPLDGMVEQLPNILELPFELEENIRRQRMQLRRMGPINPEAQKEYEEVQQRYEFLTTQVGDLQKAESGIKEIIAELDLLMEREFRKTFDAVAREFRDVFARLFGGGTARLVLTDPQDLTMTGIDIEARLPGRREQGLSLLSGGERSLTASALVFSLLKVSPTPFCVFDEVDAMLDEANVGRFRELLEELSQSTQFVIITHNRNTVQVADVIYGITMGRDSASQVLSLKLDEVNHIVE